MGKKIIELDKNDILRMLMGIDYMPEIYEHPFCRKYGSFSGGTIEPSFSFDIFKLRKLDIDELLEGYLRIKKLLDEIHIDMQDNDNKRLVKIILDYTKTELPEQKIRDVVERLMQKPNTQDVLFLRTLGVPIYGLLMRVVKKNVYEINKYVNDNRISTSDIKRCILLLNRPTREYFESHVFNKPEPC